MRVVVPDASVVVKWFFSEVHSDQALRIRDSGTGFLVPDLLYAEVGNVLWHRVQTAAISRPEAQRVVEALAAVPLTAAPVPAHDLLAAALEIACETAATVYDSLYVALAVREGTCCVTADRRLYDRVQGTPLASYVAWIGDTFLGSTIGD